MLAVVYLARAFIDLQRDTDRAALKDFVEVCVKHFQKRIAHRLVDARATTHAHA
ncbi:hypothetical protein D3C84_1219280 [compost metagenome]